ncbi:MAG TPA: hypothetical protein VME22_11720 [Solirubrobacteraceae bacterium]|nr:hypothetical protein [Solirubrobacteraceae bacterium]
MLVSEGPPLARRCLRYSRLVDRIGALLHDRLRAGVLGAVGLGIVLRLIWPSDMEYKGDEHYAYVHALVATPALLGQRASVGIPNPGMGEWVYWLIAHLERLLSGGAPSPVALDRGVMVLNVLTLVALMVFALRVVSPRERQPWLYATALQAVNPMAILFSRKLWIECLLAPFALGMLFAWWRRRTRAGAFAWGVLGLWLGQIHMTGLFLAPALVVWTALFDRRSVRWRWWVAGSALGAVTLIPWLLHLLSSHSAGAHNFSGILGSDGNFWYFWLTTPIGRPILTSFGSQAGNLLAWPQIAGVSVHLVGLAEDVSIVAAVITFAKAFGALLEGRLRPELGTDRVRRSDTTLVVSAATIGFGILLTASGVVIWRHYVTVAFVLPFLFLALAGVRAGRLGRRLLTLIVIAQATMSVGYISYIHSNRGAPGGDYGYAFDSPGNPYH